MPRANTAFRAHRTALTAHEIILPLAIVAILVLSSSVHEFAHAWVAWRRGDETAAREGRLTLNPLDHIDPFMSILLPLGLWIMSSGTMIFGGAKPVPVVSSRLRNPSRDMMWVALAGPISNFLQAVGLMVTYKLVGNFTSYGNDSLLMQALWWGIYLNVLLAVFNMVPIPPLDGSRVARHLIPAARPALDALEQFGILIVFAVIFFIPGGQRLLGEGMYHMFRFIDWLTGGPWS